MSTSSITGSSQLFIYILRCADRSFYIGKTTNIHSCLAEHKAGKASHHTIVQSPFELAYLEGPLLPKAAAIREGQLKGWPAEKKQALIDRNARRCARLRAQILASGPAIDAIGGPGAISGLQSAQQLSAKLSFIRFDQETDLLEMQHPRVQGGSGALTIGSKLESVDEAADAD